MKNDYLNLLILMKFFLEQNKFGKNSISWMLLVVFRLIRSVKPLFFQRRYLSGLQDVLS